MEYWAIICGTETCLKFRFRDNQTRFIPADITYHVHSIPFLWNSFNAMRLPAMHFPSGIPIKILYLIMLNHLAQALNQKNVYVWTLIWIHANAKVKVKFNKIILDQQPRHVVYSPFNKLMGLLACECFIEFSRRESFALYKSQIVVLGYVFRFSQWFSIRCWSFLEYMHFVVITSFDISKEWTTSIFRMNKFVWADAEASTQTILIWWWSTQAKQCRW